MLVRRTLVAGMVALALLAGVARAALLRGTPQADTIAGSSVPDTIEALGGNDRISTAWDDKRDVVNCGQGQDALNADLPDTWSNCETVSVRLSRDRTTAFDAQHETQVEPDSFSFGSTIVTAFQTGRVDGGGAAAIGWATSTDAGKHWRAGTLPQSRYDLVSDPVVAYDARHATWLVAALGSGDTGVELWVSRSRDGIAWSQPVIAADDAPEEYDKEWVACDNSARSPFKGRCYLAYVDFAAQLLGVRRSVDGGLTWSSPVRLSPGPASPIFTGPFTVVRADGTLVIPYALFAQGGQDRVGALVSADGGMTFAPPVTVAPLEFEADAALRSEGMPSADVDTAGKIYLVWSDSRLREDGVSNDVVLSTSTNGFTWSAPTRIPLPRESAGIAKNYVLPAVAVAPKTAGKTAKLAVAVYSLRLRDGCKTFLPGCTKQVDAWLVQSKDGGKTWASPRLLSAEPIRLEWLATTTRGRMLGDYMSVSWAGGRPWAILPIATRPTFGYSEAVFAATAP